jgi:hypothetical protein
MPEARGDIREIVGQPVFVPLYNLYLRYGKLFRLRWVTVAAGLGSGLGCLCIQGRGGGQGGLQAAAEQAFRFKATVVDAAVGADCRTMSVVGPVLRCALTQVRCVLRPLLLLLSCAVLLRSFGPKSFVIVSDPKYAKQILYNNADKYSKGLLR